MLHPRADRTTTNPDGTLLVYDPLVGHRSEQARVTVQPSFRIETRREAGNSASDPAYVSPYVVNTSLNASRSPESTTAKSAGPRLLEKLAQDDLENQALSKKLRICRGC